MEDKHQVRLGAVQETLFIPLAARARQAQRKHPVLPDPKAVEVLQSIDYDAAKYGRGVGGSTTVLRTAIIDFWVRGFLSAHPAGTVVEIGTGLNTRFERVDNGQVHWFDLDLPDTIELRRALFADTDRRRMVAEGHGRPWAWSCEDPRSLERSGLEVMESASITRPPREMRSQLPARYRYLIPLADPVLGKAMAITLFRASSPAAAG